MLRLALLDLGLCLLAPEPSRAKELRLLSVGLRASFAETTVLGDVPPEAFQAYDAVVNFGLPWDGIPGQAGARGHG